MLSTFAPVHELKVSASGFDATPTDVKQKRLASLPAKADLSNITATDLMAAQFVELGSLFVYTGIYLIFEIVLCG